LYQSYPVDNDITIEQRDIRLFGTTPLLAVSVFNNEENAYQLTSEAISAGTAQTMAGRFRVMYFLGYVSYQDYHELLSKAVAKYLSGNRQGSAPAGVQQLLSTTYPEMETNQQYSVEMNYRLPGTNKVTSTVNYNILYK
jgi:muramidase (phage lysozyme)